MLEKEKTFLLQKYSKIRSTTEKICAPLEVEDYVIQSNSDVSPAKWHLAHTTWFFETFILNKSKKYKPFNKRFNYLFNSYYNHVGQFYPRTARGISSRPTVKEIYQYRNYLDNGLKNFLKSCSLSELNIIKNKLILGLNHEQQHQELLLMDIKYNYFNQDNFPSYTKNKNTITNTSKLEWVELKNGLKTIGNSHKTFSFDNELPSHKVYLLPAKISSRLVTNGEYLEFIEAGGYQNPKWWLDDGWICVKKNKWIAPHYWLRMNNNWYLYTLSGLKKVKENEPVSHVSFYEADAYARWKKARLPSEFEWEAFVEQYNIKVAKESNLLELNHFHPRPLNKNDWTMQFFGDVWEWTSSAYLPYPNYKPLAGALGEYNGKFMNNQMVLRGGSCLTPKDHIRATYRNYFQPEKRWQCSGIRLAKNA